MKERQVSSAAATNYAPSFSTLACRGWQAANWLTVVVVTSTSIALVQSPLNSLMINHIKHGKALPSVMQSRGGRLAIVQALYAGLGSNFAGSSARTAYVTGAKKNNSIESSELSLAEDRKPFFQSVGYVTAISLGDVMVTQLPETKGQLIKARVIDYQFNSRTLHNLIKLGTMGFGSRLSGGFINFSALCIVEQFYAGYMPCSDVRANHFLAGAASGMTAAIFSYPCSYYRDYLISKSTVIDGKLQVPGALSLARDAHTYVKKIGMHPAAQQVMKEFIIQAPLRMARTSATFALVSGMSALLGELPLEAVVGKRFGFFSQPAGIAKAVEPKVNDVSCAKP